jgi:hypothetical protein
MVAFLQRIPLFRMFQRELCAALDVSEQESNSAGGKDAHVWPHHLDSIKNQPETTDYYGTNCPTCGSINGCQQTFLPHRKKFNLQPR